MWSAEAAPPLSNSPDRAPLPLRPHQLRGLRTIPRVRELRHVLHREIHARGAGRVRIGERATPRLLGRHVLSPHLREAEKEALLRAEPVERRAALAFER